MSAENLLMESENRKEEESLIKSAMREEEVENPITDHFSKPSDDSPVPSENLEKDYDFGSASSRRESDGESWETVSEEMRAEAEQLEDDSPEFSETMNMKALYYSYRHMNRTNSAEQKIPDNVTQVVRDDGSHIYVVGTAHFSKASQDDVEKVIRILQPDIVMVELCASRVGVLKYDEESLLKAAKEVDFSKLRYAIKEAGSVVSGIMQTLLLSMSAHITKQLGMAPGGEFRVAVREARSIPGCQVVLGDRPIQATIGRAMASLSVYQKLQLAWHLIFSKDKITKEDVEKYKQKDMIAEMLSEMTGDFPEFSRVFVEERDQYMAQMLTHYVENIINDVPEYIPLRRVEHHIEEHDIQSEDLDITSDNVEQMHKSEYKAVVVAVVGIGHMKGIVDNIGKEFNLKELCFVPPASLASRTLKFFIKAGFVAGLSWAVYSLFRWINKDKEKTHVKRFR